MKTYFVMYLMMQIWCLKYYCSFLYTWSNIGQLDLGQLNIPYILGRVFSLKGP
jgi:hypothetical protein